MTDIRIRTEVQSQLCQLAFATFTSRPGEGAALEGPLFGDAGMASVEVTGFGHSAENRQDVVGHWRVDRRLNQPNLISTPGVCVAVAPLTVQMAEALIWQRTNDGVDLPSRRHTFRAETRLPKRITPQLQTAPEPAIVAAVESRRDWNAIAWMVAFFMLAASGAWLWPANAAETVDHPRLTLAVQSSGKDLRVHWREFGGAGRIESALLTVREGSGEITVDLLERYKSVGEVVVHSRGREIVVSLRVRRQGQPTATQTITYIEPLLARTPKPVSKSNPGA